MAKRAKKPSTLYFRGTQHAETGTTVRGVLSYTPCLGAAIVWSAQPGGMWGESPAHFVAGSTVVAATIEAKKRLELGGGFLDESLVNVLQKLDYGKKDGISEEEVKRVFNYMHNRLIGKAKGSTFNYNVFDEGGDPRDKAEVPFSLSFPQSLISMARDEFEYADGDERKDIAASVVADAFVFADAPAVQKAAARLGYDAIVYLDVFQGAEPALRDVMGIAPDDVDCLQEVNDPFDDDGGGGYVWAHETIRPLAGAVVTQQWAEPGPKVAEDFKKLIAEAAE